MKNERNKNGGNVLHFPPLYVDRDRYTLPESLVHLTRYLPQI